MKPIQLLSIFILLSILLAACSAPAGETAPAEPTVNSELATMVALTLTAVQSPTPNIPHTETALPPTATITPSPTASPTFSPAFVEIGEDTNCRSGPGQGYPVLYVFRPKTKAEITGRYQNNSYWIVKMPNSTSECWMWGEFATPSGGFAAMPEFTPPPTSTPAPPAPPRALSYTFACSFSDATVNLTWTDVAIDESNYRILRNGESVAELPANSTAYTDVTSASSGSSFTYTVEAFNNAGKGSASISFNCP